MCLNNFSKNFILLLGDPRETAETEYLTKYKREFSIMEQAGFTGAIPQRSLLNLYQNNLFPYRHQQLFAER